MLATPRADQRNRHAALVFGVLPALAALAGGWLYSPCHVLLGLCPLTYWLVRRRFLRRLKVANSPFPPAWEQILETHIAYFRALADADKQRFRQMVLVFLDEVRITGIRTEVDDLVRVLVAASAIIPVFGFQDWEYRRLGEVLIYPGSFSEEYQSTGHADENILGMVGLQHLSGVMILSKPSLLESFDNPSSNDHVGIHEFAHLVEETEVDHGLPAEVPAQAVKQWVHYVAKELAEPSKSRSYLSDYAYTNEHEFLAVLSEYFFKSPDLLQEKDPQLYSLLRQMFHQDTQSLLRRPSSGRKQYDKNALCPCGSGKKFKQCCL
jgi:Mlc titration factor MtfA (ptsG expression regulator)